MVAVAATDGLFYAAKGEVQTISTAVGGHKLVKLSDGSRIELNTDTVIRIKGWQRTVMLAKGEAFFEIKHDALHPFTVDVAGQRITDLGTKFVVRRKPDGKSRWACFREAPDSNRNMIGAQSRVAVLTPGDFATATPQFFLGAKGSARRFC